MVFLCSRYRPATKDGARPSPGPNITICYRDVRNGGCQAVGAVLMSVQPSCRRHTTCMSAPQALEELLCWTLGRAEFGQYLARLAGSIPAPCTRVWQAGAIAYRCLDCQTVPHSAVCVGCFQASFRPGHDS